ncbi:hypothetical protein COOONC_07099 [Cooperia oncophora]
MVRVAFITFFLTVKVKRLLRRHYEQVVAPHVASGSIDEKRLWSTISIATMDEVYTCRVAGFRNRDEYYTACESLPHLHKIRVPTIFLFAKDDPILPKCLWEPVKPDQRTERTKEEVRKHLEDMI